MSGDELGRVGICELQFEARACWCSGVRINNVAKQAGVAEALYRFLEIAVGGILADLQAAGRENLFVGVARGSGNLKRGELTGIGWRFGAGRLLLGYGRTEDHQEARCEMRNPAGSPV